MAAFCEEGLEEETPMSVTPTKNGMRVIHFGDDCRWCLDETSVGSREWGEDVHSLIIGNENVHNEHGERIVDELDVLIAGWLCTSCKAAEKAAEGGQQ
jgi:hypothetical protein